VPLSNPAISIGRFSAVFAKKPMLAETWWRMHGLLRLL
jgi:hypothetical protein